MIQAILIFTTAALLFGLLAVFTAEQLGSRKTLTRSQAAFSLFCSVMFLLCVLVDLVCIVLGLSFR